MLYRYFCVTQCYWWIIKYRGEISINKQCEAIKASVCVYNGQKESMAADRGFVQTVLTEPPIDGQWHRPQLSTGKALEKEH